MGVTANFLLACCSTLSYNIPFNITCNSTTITEVDSVYEGKYVYSFMQHGHILKVSLKVMN